MKKLYINGDIITMEEDILYTNAVLTENGKIVKIGDNALKHINDKDIDIFDLNGKTLLPAFIDAHSHFSAVANSFLQVPLDECSSIEEMKERIEKFIIQNNVKKGQWIIANGYDHNEMREKRHPNKNELDKFTSDYPLIIQHKSGHMGVLNSNGLNKLGIDENTKNIDGGVIEKINGKLTGYLEENSYLYYLKQIPMPDINSLLNACKKAQDKYASYGITTVQEGMMIDLLLPLYEYLCKSSALYLDVVGYVGIDYIKDYLEKFELNKKIYNNNFKIDGIKIFLDGSPQGKTAWLRSPYKDEKDYCGYPTMKDNDVYNSIKYAYENGMQIIAHCNGDRACEQYLTQTKRLENKNCDIKSIRPVMIHAQLLGIDQIDTLKECGIIPSFFVAHTYHWGDIHIKNLGFDRARSISPVKSSIDKGVKEYTFHQDAPVIEPDMIETIWCAVNRKTKSGVILGEEECVDVLSALKAVTINSAYQYFEESSKGSIKEGKNADFVILSDNPLKYNIEKLRDIKVIYTIKSDKIIYKNK